MNIKFGMDNYYVRYLKRFLNHELGISNKVLGEFNKNDLQTLITYLNMPNVKTMFEVAKEISKLYPQLDELFNVNYKDDEIQWTSRRLDTITSKFISDNKEGIKKYCQSVGWNISDVDEWLDTTKDINQDGIIDMNDVYILYNIIHDIQEYDEETTKRADVNLDGIVDNTDYNILNSYINENKLLISIKKTNRVNYFPNEDMKVFINQFDGTFLYNYAIKDGSDFDNKPHPNDTKTQKIAIYKCKPGQKITIAHNSANTEHLVIGSSTAKLFENIPNVILQNVVEIDLKPEEGYQYTATSVVDSTGYDANYICIQCPSSYNDLTSKEYSVWLEVGDINFDGKIDMEDYQMLAEYTATGPGADKLFYNKANWTPNSRQLAVMDIPIWDDTVPYNIDQTGQAGTNGIIDTQDAVFLYKFITHDPSAPPSLGITTYKYRINDEESESDNVKNLLIIDGHYDKNVNIPFKEFLQDDWVIHHKFFNYLLNMAVHKYTNTENISYIQKLLQEYYPEHIYDNNFLTRGSYNDKMRRLMYEYQRSHTNYTIGDLNLDGKIDETDLVLERQVIECINADINGDNVIDQEDFNLLKNYIDGIGTLTPEQLEKADINFDGVIDLNDLAIIQEFLDGTRIDNIHVSGDNSAVLKYRADTN